MLAYTSREAADLARIPIQQVRWLARAGLIQHHKDGRGRYRFGFQDVVLLRAARSLQQHHISSRRVWHALRAIRGRLPAHRPLTSVRFLSAGNRVIVKDGDAAWEALSGQGTLDFNAQRPGDAVTPLAHCDAGQSSQDSNTTAEQWYELGVAFEVLDAGNEAETAYRRALELDPQFADAHLKLSQLYEREGRRQAALRHLESYRRLTRR
jgi:tetratricopeptide (TPR) repeat protein